jgi:hypothetical protein
VPSGKGERQDVLDRLDQRDRAVGHLAHRADHLGVAFVAHEQDVPTGFDHGALPDGEPC